MDYVGIDVHQKTPSMGVWSSTGEVLERAEIGSRPDQLSRWLIRLGRIDPTASIKKGRPR